MNKSSASQRVALGVITTIFFMWGFITVLNDVLIPHLKSVFTLNYAEAMLVQFIFFGAYFVMSLPAGRVVARFGYRDGIVIGLIITGIGALMFIPAARMVSYPLFLGAFFVLASGITLLQVAANPYVSLLGDPRYASSRLNLAQALNSLGTTLAPKIGGLLILSSAVLGASELAALAPAERAVYQLQQAQNVTGPYLLLAGVLFALAAGVWLFRLPPLTEATARGDNQIHSFAEVLRHRHVLNGIIGIFLYVGAEVAIGSFLISYLAMPDIGNISASVAAGYVSLYWGGAMIGRFVGFALLRVVDARLLLGLFAGVASALLLLTMISSGQIALWSIIAIGLFNSIMFPNIFTLGIDRLGTMTDKAASLLIMAIVGGAIVPLLQGLLADHIGVQHAFVLPLLCYLYIVWYGFRGSKVDDHAALLAAVSRSPVATH
ncbi:sugar MFS transporter [Pseudolysobacter antarcticus]|uniref:Sugar MFS transporter n=1 Tax=Pseudolysobacter antarcticus TaxID=2511995 RepID=A0A411HK64_9GAMM|nr:sugar MFS transporter [Pseudolysobacter antarcticus]QBB70767.1 sugar MFS transporter [Pseudolysobacter antarcticus]